LVNVELPVLVLMLMVELNVLVELAESVLD
jgi:hypothetical protein